MFGQSSTWGKNGERRGKRIKKTTSGEGSLLLLKGGKGFLLKIYLKKKKARKEEGVFI